MSAEMSPILQMVMKYISIFAGIKQPQSFVIFKSDDDMATLGGGGGLLVARCVEVGGGGVGGEGEGEVPRRHPLHTQ